VEGSARLHGGGLHGGSLHGGDLRTLLRSIMAMSSEDLELALAGWPLVALAHALGQHQEALQMLADICGEKSVRQR
jgi:hypothetical protein